ncbi:MAG: PEP-CTERM sorting domain-containing protein [Planctomycetia bacterium]|nr:PEP-CTERM sorting domain-containing protein [Planctomycetia bacterium]
MRPNWNKNALWLAGGIILALVSWSNGANPTYTGTSTTDSLTDLTKWSEDWRTGTGTIFINGSGYIDGQFHTTLTTVIGNAANGDYTLNILEGADVRFTGSRPVFVNANGTKVTINMTGGSFVMTANNCCYGEEGKGSATINLSGGTLTYSGLCGSRSSGSIIMTQQTGKAAPTWNVVTGMVLGWEGNEKNNAYQGVVVQKAGTANILGKNSGLYWTTGSGITFTSSNKAAETMPSGQYIISDGTLNTYRIWSSTGYDEENYVPMGSGVAHNANYDSTHASKNLIITGGRVNIVNASGLNGGNGGTLSVPTYMGGGILNVLNINATCMLNDTFVQEGGWLSPDGGAEVSLGVDNTRTLNVDPVGISSTTITGNYTLANDGGVKLDIGASGADQMTVNGNALLNGTIRVVLNKADLTTNTNGTLLTVSGTLNKDAVTLQTSSLVNLAWDGNALKYTLSDTRGEYYWTGGTTGGDMWDDANWNAPGASGNNLTFGNAANPAKTTLDTAFSAHNFTMATGNGSTGDLTIAGGGHLAITGALTIGNGGTARLEIQEGGSISNVTATIGQGAGSDGTLAIVGGTHTLGQVNAGNGTGKGTFVLGESGNALANPTVTASRLYLAGQEMGASQGEAYFYGGQMTVNGFDMAYGEGSQGKLVMDGGNLTVNGEFRTSERGNSQATIEMKSGSLTLNAQTTWGSNGKMNVTISGGTLTALGQFVLNFYGQDDVVNQTGGTVNLWGNTAAGWGVRTNPGYIANYTAASQTTYHAGLQFGNVSWRSPNMRSKNSNQTWNISGGELNTLRVSTLIANSDTNMLNISGNAVVNIIDNGATADKYYGILAAPTSMTGGTLNVATIYAQGARYDANNTLVSANYNYMLNGTFLQEGGVLSPDGGSIVNNAFVASETGISSTKIIGNYTLQGTGAIKLDIHEWATERSANNDFIEVTGTASIGGAGIQIALAEGLLRAQNEVLVLSAGKVTDALVAEDGWNRQGMQDGEKWIARVSDDGKSLYAILTSEGAVWWDETAKAWSDDWSQATELIVGSSSIGNSPTANAVLTENMRVNVSMHLGYDAGAVGSVTLDNAEMTAYLLNIGRNGTGTFTVNANATLHANNLFLASNAGAKGTFISSGTTTIDNLYSTNDGTFQVLGGTTEVKNPVTFANSTVEVTGDAQLHLSQTNFHSGSMNLSGQSKTSLLLSTGQAQYNYFGSNGGTMTLTLSDSAQMDIDSENSDSRSVKFGAANSTANVNVQDNAVLVLGRVSSRNVDEAYHLGDGGQFTMNQSGGTVYSSVRLYLGEIGSSLTDVYNLSGGSFYSGLLLVSGSCNAEFNISGTGYYNAYGQLCIGYGNNTTATVNQTGGVADIWGDRAGRWGSNMGIQFGGSGGSCSNGRYNLSGGQLNTYRIWGKESNSSPLVTLSGGELNIIAKAGDTSAGNGALEVPISMTGGVLNAVKIVGMGETAGWNDTSGTFYQRGGILSPDGGSVVSETVAIGDYGNITAQKFAANPTRIGSTAIEGNYVLEMNGDSQSTPTILLDFYTSKVDSDLITSTDMITVSGDMTFGDNVLLTLRFNDWANTANGIYENVIQVDGDVTGNFSGLQLLGFSEEIITDPFILSSMLHWSPDGALSIHLDKDLVPEPGTWVLLLLGGGLLIFLQKSRRKGGNTGS